MPGRGQGEVCIAVDAPARVVEPGARVDAGHAGGVALDDFGCGVLQVGNIHLQLAGAHCGG